MGQCDGLGNQQERRTADLQWFGGVFDGEGCISIVRATRAGYGGRSTLGTQIRFTNSSEVVIAEVRRILSDHQIPHHVGLRPATKGRRAVWHISINGMKRCARFLPIFTPFLRGKRWVAETTAAFIGSRLSKAPGAPYSDQEIDWFGAMRDHHGYLLAESSEAICRALRQEQRYGPTSARKAESAAELETTAPLVRVA